MNIESHNMGAYNLHFIKTNKFKTYAITVKFLGHLTRENVTKRALIPYVLKAGTKNYPNKQKLSLRTDDLFDLSISVSKFPLSISRINNITNIINNGIKAQYNE